MLRGFALYLNQGFGSVTFYQAHPGHLDTDPPVKKALELKTGIFFNNTSY